MSSLKIELEVNWPVKYHIRHKHVILLDDEGNEYIYQKKTKFLLTFQKRR